MSIAHREKNVVVVDCIRVAKPPFSPDAVVADFATTLKSYGLHSVRGDRYGGEWPAERFRVYGVKYEPAEKAKVEIYKNSIPIFNGQRCELPDHPKLVTQLIGLERQTTRGGRESIDHPRGGHDDVANAVCGALLLAEAGKKSGFRPTEKMLEMAAQPSAYRRRQLGDLEDDRPRRGGIPVAPF
ncbi:MAG TPA: hypothetical protein VIF88_02070 [Methylocystis sp.]|jgi:hypothetical protein